MTDPIPLVAMASAGTVAFSIVAAAVLRGWQGWLDLRQLQASEHGSRGGRRSGGDLGELRARVRRLEAIANGGE